jgi:hypothetical protein
MAKGNLRGLLDKVQKSPGVATGIGLPAVLAAMLPDDES